MQTLTETSFDSWKRYALAGGFAALVTALLMLLMQDLIKPTGEIVEPPRPSPPIVLVRLDRKTPVPEPVRPQPPEPVKQEPLVTLQHTIDPIAGGFGGAVFVPPPVATGGTLTGSSNSDVIAFLTVAPDYPDRAARRGIEGYVVVEYSIDELGRVVEAHVIFAEPVNIFDRAAINAVKRYKYKPKLVDGQPVPVHQVRQKISFELDG